MIMYVLAVRMLDVIIYIGVLQELVCCVDLDVRVPHLVVATSSVPLLQPYDKL
jgi:hypothetical protein